MPFFCEAKLWILSKLSSIEQLADLGNILIKVLIIAAHHHCSTTQMCVYIYMELLSLYVYCDCCFSGKDIA